MKFNNIELILVVKNKYKAESYKIFFYENKIKKKINNLNKYFNCNIMIILKLYYKIIIVQV